MMLVFSVDDGRDVDLLVAKLLKRYELPGIFYIPTTYTKWGDALTLTELEQLVKDGFDLGGHTTTHPQDIKELTYDQQYSEIADNKKYLEDIAGKTITSFCYPRGKYNEDTMKIVKEVGYLDARTVDNLNTDVPEDPYVSKPTFHFQPNKPEYAGKNIIDYAFELYQLAKSKGPKGYFHLWCHGWELMKYKQFENLENLFKKIYEDRKTNV